MHPADDFPQDDSGYGFDNIGDVLSLSPALMEKYFAAAEKATRAALFGPPKLAPTLTRLRSDGRRQGDAQSVPATYDVTGLSMPNAFHAIYRAPVDGEYAIRIVMGGTRPAASDPVTVSLWIDERQVEHKLHDPDRAATFSDDRQDFGGQTTEMRVKLTAGDHRWRSQSRASTKDSRHAITVRTRRRGPSLPRRPSVHRPARRPKGSISSKKVRRDPGGAGEDSVERGPCRLARNRRSLHPDDGALTREPRHDLHVRAQGRPASALVRVAHHDRPRLPRVPSARVTPAEIEKLVALVHQAQEDEDSFDEGLAVGIEAVLVSPDFLFRIEHDHTTPASVTSYPISQHELATRLSYFLWSSMPDAELRRAADTGTLRNPQVLAAQVRRMLRDPKVSAAGGELRRAVAAVPRARIADARQDTVS